MKRNVFNGIVQACIWSLILWTSLAAGSEPQPPVLNTAFDPDTEAEIAGFSSLPVDAVYAKLEDKKFFSNDKLTYKAISGAFGKRKKNALDFATSRMQAPLTEKAAGKLVNTYRDYSVSKKIFEVFPSDAAALLADLYKNGDPVTRRNVINASGNVTGTAIRKLLIDALDDKTESGEIYPEKMGEPMRICDAAYNQLVLRYKVRNVMRTIGTAFDTQVRDYHIGILKDLIAQGKCQ